MSPTPSVETRPLTLETWADLVRLLSPSQGCDGCWCVNHHIRPGDPDVVGDAARQALQGLVRDGKARGLIAYRAGRPVGWCGLDRRRDLPGHDCVDETDPDRWSLHCLFVPPEERGTGVARALVAAARAAVAEAGDSCLEAYARPEALGDRAFPFLPPAALYSDGPSRCTDSRDPNYERWILDT